jgi:hypothetical protein
MRQTYSAHERLLLDKEQRYLSLIYLFLDGCTDTVTFQHRFLGHWAEEREELWQAAQCSIGRDFRPLVRLFDRLDTVCSTGGKHHDLRLQVLNLRDEYQAAKAGDTASVLAAPPYLPLFEHPLADGWVYPCTCADIRQQLALVPEQDTEGLLAVGLAAPKREDRRYYGTYWYWSWRIKTPVIHLYAWPASLSFKTRRHYSVGEAAQCFAVELSYGMQAERAGCRLLCRWETDCLRRYVAEHVLLHEIGHHVQRRQRLRVGFSAFPGHTASEQFADDYASRGARRGRSCRDAPW